MRDSVTSSQDIQSFLFDKDLIVTSRSVNSVRTIVSLEFFSCMSICRREFEATCLLADSLWTLRGAQGLGWVSH